MAVSGPPYAPPLQPFEDIRFLVRDRGSDFTRSYHVVFQGHCATILRTAVGVPDDERDARRPTHGRPSGHRPDPGVVQDRGYLA
jgi:hypothetical protein